MRNFTKILFIGLMLGAMIMAGCTQQAPADEEPNQSMIPEAPDMDMPEEPEPQTIEVTMDEFSIMPENMNAEAGTVRFEVANSGSWKHEFMITGNGVQQEIEGGIPAGETRNVELDLEAGTYQITCPIPGHTEKGMSATLTVE